MSIKEMKHIRDLQVGDYVTLVGYSEDRVEGIEKTNAGLLIHLNHNHEQIYDEDELDNYVNCYYVH